MSTIFLARIAVCAVTGIACLLALGSDQALAAHVSCGDTITQNTRLDSDLINCPGSGVVIGADNITLDLGGHVIDGTRTGIGDDSGVNNADGHDGVTIENGTVQEFQYGVFVREGNNVTATKLVVTDSISNGVLFIRAGNCVVEKSSGARNGGGSINLLESEHCLVAKNTLLETYADRTSGILLFKSNHNTVQKNSTSGAFRAGIELGTATDNLVEKNSASESTDGLFVFDSADNTLRGNRTFRNLARGVFVWSNSSGTVLNDNLAEENGDDGIRIDNPNTFVARNTANVNRDLGIQAVPGVTNGGGNKARGNVNPLQCTNVACK